MKTLQLLFKSVLGMLAGINLGAVVGGVVGAAVVGPEWVIGAMVLGAMAGSLLGSAAGFAKGLNLEERAAAPERALRPVRAHYASVRIEGRLR